MEHYDSTQDRVDEAVRADAKVRSQVVAERQVAEAGMLFAMLQMSEEELAEIPDAVFEAVLARVGRVFNYGLILRDPSMTQEQEITMWLAIAMFFNDMVHGCEDADDAAANFHADHYYRDPNRE